MGRIVNIILLATTAVAAAVWGSAEVLSKRVPTPIPSQYDTAVASLSMIILNPTPLALQNTAAVRPYVELTYPSQILLDDEAIATMSVDPGYLDDAEFRVELMSGELEITPTAMTFSFRQVLPKKASVIIGSKSLGRKKLLLRMVLVTTSTKIFEKHDSPYEQSFEIEVTSPSVVLGLTRAHLEEIKTLASVVGLPGLLLLLCTTMIANAKAMRESKRISQSKRRKQ